METKTDIAIATSDVGKMCRYDTRLGPEIGRGNAALTLVALDTYLTK
jgi:hypothetical protein